MLSFCEHLLASVHIAQVTAGFCPAYHNTTGAFDDLFTDRSILDTATLARAYIKIETELPTGANCLR